MQPSHTQDKAHEDPRTSSFADRRTSVKELAAVLPRRIHALAHSIQSLHAALSEDPDPAFGLGSLEVGVRLGELLFESSYILNELGLREEALKLEAVRQRLHREVLVEQKANRLTALTELNSQVQLLSKQFPLAR